MPQKDLPPPLTSPDRLLTELQQQGFAVLGADTVCALAGVSLPALQALEPSWNALPPDQYLKDGGRYRRRRHASLQVSADHVEIMPHRAHWQPVSYNALHGGMQRWFDPMQPEVLAQPAWQALLQWLASVASRAQGATNWYTEAHQFRIDTTDGIGRPTPEGAHRDGVTRPRAEQAPNAGRFSLDFRRALFEGPRFHSTSRSVKNRKRASEGASTRAFQTHPIAVQPPRPPVPPDRADRADPAPRPRRRATRPAARPDRPPRAERPGPGSSPPRAGALRSWTQTLSESARNRAVRVAIGDSR